MVSDSVKTLALVIKAIKNLRELKGSTSKEILHYLSSVYDISPDVVRRQMNTALKRGVAYGILKRNGTHFILPTNDELKCQEVAEQEVNLLDVCRRNRIQRKMGCKCKKKRRGSRKKQKKKKCCRCKKKKKTKKRRKQKQSRGCRKKKRKRKKKCKCGGLGHRRYGDRMKKCSVSQQNEKFHDKFNDKFNNKFPKSQLENYDSAPSENSSLSSISSATD